MEYHQCTRKAVHPPVSLSKSFGYVDMIFPAICFPCAIGTEISVILVDEFVSQPAPAPGEDCRPERSVVAAVAVVG